MPNSQHNVSCGHCADGWRCLEHPEEPAGHGGCLCGSIACRDPKCPPITHIPCLSC